MVGGVVSHTCWPFVHLLWRNTNLDLLPSSLNRVVSLLLSSLDYLCVQDINPLPDAECVLQRLSLWQKESWQKQWKGGKLYFGSEVSACFCLIPLAQAWNAADSVKVGAGGKLPHSWLSGSRGRRTAREEGAGHKIDPQKPTPSDLLGAVF